MSTSPEDIEPIATYRPHLLTANADNASPMFDI